MLNQRIPNPIWSLAQLPPQVYRGGVGPTTSLGSNQQLHHYAMAATQQVVQIRSTTPSFQAPVVETSGSSEMQGGMHLTRFNHSNTTKPNEPEYKYIQGWTQFFFSNDGTILL